ncbi:MAG: hypothetical protein KF878_23900 [Planctomycetes bacterium]|nr:hypothetical protein [Planctomycetota bacterium]
MRVLPLLVGFAVDLAGTVLTLLALALLHIASAEGSPTALERSFASPAWLGANVLVGLAFTILGGAVAAALARGAELRHALVLGAITTAIGALAVVGALWTAQELPATWALLVSLALTVPASCLGGQLVAAHRQRTMPPLDGQPLGRCPFCHEDVRRGDAEVVCDRCLARHHDDCWSESARCAACQNLTALTHPRASATRSPGTMGVAAALGAVALAAGAWALHPLLRGSSLSATTPMAPTAGASVVAVETAPPALQVTLEAAPASDVAATWPALEGPPDADYREAPAEGSPFGGPEPAPDWREVMRLDGVEQTLQAPVWCGDARRIALAPAEQSSVLLCTGARPDVVRIEVGDRVRCLALSGNRLLVTTERTPGIAVIDVDRAALLPARIAIPVAGASLAVASDEPRRVYAAGAERPEPGQVNAAGQLFLVDAGRLAVVASVALPGRSGDGQHVVSTDGLGRWAYEFGLGEATVFDPARGLRARASCKLLDRLGRPDRGGWFVFEQGGPRLAGSLAPTEGPGGVPRAVFLDGSLLVASTRGFERRHPLTNATVGAPLALDRFFVGNAMQLAGSNRFVVLVPSVPMAIRVRDLPAVEPIEPPPPAPLRLKTVPPSVVYVGDGWTYAPEAADRRPGQRLEVEGPPGSTWDGPVLGWRPRTEHVGEHAITIKATGAGPERVAREPVTVRLRTFAVDFGYDSVLPDMDQQRVRVPPRLLPSGRLLVWRTKAVLTAIEVGTWHRRTVTLADVQGLAEVGDSLWVATGDALVELSIPELTPRRQLQIEGAAPRHLAALPDGRLGWVESGAALRALRLTPSDGALEVFQGPATAIGGREVVWRDAERFIVADASGAGATEWRCADGRLQRAGTLPRVPQVVLPDGTAFLEDRVLRPDGSTLRSHPHAPPWPDHEGRRYATLEPTGEGGLRIAVYQLPDGELVHALPEPAGATAVLRGARRRALLHASRARAVVLYNSDPPEGRRQYVIVPYGDDP